MPVFFCLFSPNGRLNGKYFDLMDVLMGNTSRFPFVGIFIRSVIVNGYR